MVPINNNNAKNSCHIQLLERAKHVAIALKISYLMQTELKLGARFMCNKSIFTETQTVNTL